jgi:hypothetical protein
MGCIFFEVRSQCLRVIKTSCGFKGETRYIYNFLLNLMRENFFGVTEDITNNYSFTLAKIRSRDFANTKRREQTIKPQFSNRFQNIIYVTIVNKSSSLRKIPLSAFPFRFTPRRGTVRLMQSSKTNT